jgi:predicted nucleic acid-binding protein
MIKSALDTNILIYNHSKVQIVPYKRAISENLLRANPVISSQVISEYLNYMKNKLKIEKNRLMRACVRWLKKCTVQPVSRSTVELASRLIDKYDFQLFDGIIVASALEANCGVLYSEDMQHGQVIEASLKIINPYI